MANISQELSKIQSAVYGEEVRGSIHDAIQAMNEQANESDTKATNAQNLAVEAREAAFVAQDSAAAKAAEAAQSALEAANTVNVFDQHASQVTANLDDHASQITANFDDHASQITANLDNHVSEITANFDDHASQITEEIDESKDTAVSSAAAAKRSEELARKFSGDVVDKVVDLESLDPVDAVGNTSLFVVSSGGENKSATGKQVLDYIFSNNEDREVDISDPDRIVQTSDSEQVITTFSKDENNNDVIITKRIPNDGIFVYVTETVITGNLISVTNRTEEKEV